MSDDPNPKSSRHAQRWAEATEDGTTVVEEFVPAWRSLAWRLGQAYWHQQGLQAFTTNAVPNVVTNDGYLATRTAETLMASCVAADAEGTLEDEIRVMELAVGLGQHARMFLRRFVALCEAEELDYADRLVFFATDLSKATLNALKTSPTLRVSGVRVRLGQVDATDPGRFRDLETGEVEAVDGLRLIRSNYLLCVLPFMLLLRREGIWCEQYVRTQVQDTVNARRVLGDRLDPIITAARAGDDESLRRIASHEYLFSTERVYVPIENEELLMGEAAAAFFDAARTLNEEGVERTLFSHGALKSLDRSLDLLLDDGFMIHADYGWRTLRTSADIGNFQYFSGSTAIGLNFPLVEHFVEEFRTSPGRVVAPRAEDKAPILTRMVARRALPATEEVFVEAFDGAAHEAFWEHINGLSQVKEGTAGEEILARIELAHERYPFNWLLLGQAASAATFAAKNPERGLELAMKGLEICPAASAGLWCEYGDALYALERYEQAHEAFERAQKINPEDPRVYLSLAWSHAALWRVEDAIRSLARGIELDELNLYGEAMVEKLKSVMEQRDALTEMKQQYRTQRYY